MFSTTPLSPGFDIDKSEARRVISILTVTFVFATVTVPLRFMSKWKLKLPFFLEDWLVLGASVLAAGPVWTFEESARMQELGRHVEYNEANAQINFRKKISPFLLSINISQIRKHLRAHIDHQNEDQIHCPASLQGGATTPFCSHSFPMTMPQFTSGKAKRKQSGSESETSVKVRSHKLKKLGGGKISSRIARTQPAQADAVQSVGGRQALQQLSSNKIVKSTASILGSEALGESAEIVDDSNIDLVLR